MNFEKSKNPYKALRIGSGRAIKMLWVSMGAGAKMDDKKVLAMIKRWQSTQILPYGVWPLIKRHDGVEQFVETIYLQGELIEWNNQTYQLPSLL